METKVEKTVKIVNINVNKLHGIMEDGSFVAKTNEYLRNLPEEQIASKVSLDVYFDSTIKKATTVDGTTKDVDTKLLQIDMKRFVPKIADSGVNPRLTRVRQELFDGELLTAWLANATLTVVQERHDKDSIVEGTSNVYTKDCWSLDITSIQLDSEIEAEIDEAVAVKRAARLQRIKNKILE